MALRIGHASKDENSKGRGGTAGDQTGKEVCIRNWYNGSWKFVARAKDPAVAERIAANCEAGCNNPNLGYDQSGRNTALEAAQLVDFTISAIAEACEVDCSSFVTLCVHAAGVRLWNGGNAPTTSNLKARLEATGAFEILTEEKYLTGPNYLRRGDILCKPGSHTVIVLDNGAYTSEAEASPAKPVVTYYSVRLPVLKKGMKGDAVRALQTLLIGRGYSCGKWGADGDFGNDTENALECFQEDNVDTEGKPLEADGVAGPKTWAAIIGTIN